MCVRNEADYLATMSDNLVNLMVQNNISIRQLAVKTGLTRSKVAHLRASYGFPSLKTVLVLCEYFGVSVEWFTGVKNEN